MEYIIGVIGGFGTFGILSFIGINFFLAPAIKSWIENTHKKHFEDYKVLLINYGKHYEKQFEAYVALNTIFQKLIMSGKWPNMDEQLLLVEIVNQFETLEKEFYNIISDYELVLDAEINKNISDCVKLCSEGKFKHIPEKITEDQKNMAKSVFDFTKKSIDLFKEKINAQIKIPHR